MMQAAWAAGGVGEDVAKIVVVRMVKRVREKLNVGVDVGVVGRWAFDLRRTAAVPDYDLSLIGVASRQLEAIVLIFT